MNRSVSGTSGFVLRARDSSAWCIVGTAEYHVTLCSLTTGQKFSGLNRGGATTVPPVCSVESVDATSPCTWKSGMTHSATSSSVRSYVAAMFRSDVVRFRCVSGTRFGRDVVPLVCSTSATSSVAGHGESLALAPFPPPAAAKFTCPASSIVATMCIAPGGATSTIASPPSGPVMTADAFVSSR